MISSKVPEKKTMRNPLTTCASAWPCRSQAGSLPRPTRPLPNSAPSVTLNLRPSPSDTIMS